MNRYGIKTYARYRDDILLISIARPPWAVNSASKYIGKLIDSAKEVYKLTVDTVSSDFADFLDMTIYKPRSHSWHNRRAVKPFVKKTCQRVLLVAGSSLVQGCFNVIWIQTV